MRLMINDYLDTMATSVSNGCSASGFSSTLTALIVKVYKNIMAKFGTWGNHYIGESDNEVELINALKELHENMIRHNAFRFDLIKAEFPDILDGKDVYTENGSNSANTVAETSPINSVIGDITTPNAKGNAVGSFSNTRNETTIANKKSAYMFAMENNIYNIVEDIYKHLVYEYVTLY